MCTDCPFLKVAYDICGKFQGLELHCFSVAWDSNVTNSNTKKSHNKNLYHKFLKFFYA